MRRARPILLAALAVLAVAVLAVAVLSARGGGSKADRPAPVVVAAPAFPPLDRLSLVEEDGVGERLARAGKEALVGAARLWRLERDGRVVGALQVSAWAADVDRGDDEPRAVLDSAVHTGRTRRQSVGPTTVTLSSQPAATGDRRPGLVRATWFANGGFVVLSLRDDLDADQLLARLVPATLTATP